MSANLLPSSVMKLLENQNKKSNQEVIIDYMISEPGAIILSPKQEDLLKRWMKADELLRTGRFNSREVANALVKIFSTDDDGKKYSIATAWRDIEDARFIFGSTRKSAKSYRLHAHLDRIEEAMINAQRLGDMKLLPKLYDAYTYALSLVKDDENKTPLPTAIIFNMNIKQGAQLMSSDISPEDAKETARKRLEEKGISTDFLDFEET